MHGWLVVNSFLNDKPKFSGLNELLLTAASRCGHRLEVVTNAELLVVPGNGVLYRGNIIKNEDKPDYVLFWDKDLHLAKTLEEEGIRLFNCSESIATCDDKALTHMKLQQAGVPMPKTIIAPMTYENIGYRSLDFLDTVIEVLSFPMVIKELFGSFGLGVYCVKNREELFSCIKTIGAKPLLFQEYIAESSGHDLRLQVIGNRVVAAMHRYSTDGDFRANLTRGGRMESHIPSQQEIQLALDAARCLQLDFGGVDILLSKSGPVVCEVNSNAHFVKLSECTGTDIASEILYHVKQELSEARV